MKKSCPICGCLSHTCHEVLWPELCNEWELTSYEIEYINKQQGMACKKCGSNMRSQVLALAIQSAFHSNDLFSNFIISNEFRSLKILEINEAGNIHDLLKKHSGHQIIKYPEYDMMQLDLPSDQFDLVVHSDTLEHVINPLQALKECRRVLKEEGKCIFTVPIIVDRLTRSRSGLSASYHGGQGEQKQDYLVFTEFGCDSWKMMFEAGFKNVKLHALEYPIALAIEATK